MTTTYVLRRTNRATGRSESWLRFTSISYGDPQAAAQLAARNWTTRDPKYTYRTVAAK